MDPHMQERWVLENALSYESFRECYIFCDLFRKLHIFGDIENHIFCDLLREYQIFRFRKCHIM